MIHDAQVEVTCDAAGCDSFVHVQLPFVYRNYTPASGQYDHSEETVERLLRSEEWTVCDGKHYCFEDCAPQVMEPTP